ncbi:unnamed protein product [Trichobilharzia regenti]|uniref:Pecanex-like protein n=1 Tax=Trichobilharzia regenti TaxID=157069 RepID=A0A183VNH6_TRIRE|nr:unnamed protein product [Trichobilharzia regenti]VDP97911.1 unnamed protein product [Trichobilharzia regenti]
MADSHYIQNLSSKNLKQKEYETTRSPDCIEINLSSLHENKNSTITKNDVFMNNLIYLLNSSGMIRRTQSSSADSLFCKTNADKMSIQPEFILSETNQENIEVMQNFMNHDHNDQIVNLQKSYSAADIMNRLNKMITETHHKSRSDDELTALLMPLLKIQPNQTINETVLPQYGDINCGFDCRPYQGPKTPPSPRIKKTKSALLHEMNYSSSSNVTEKIRQFNDQSQICFDSNCNTSCHTLPIDQNKLSVISTIPKFCELHTNSAKCTYRKHLSDISSDINLHSIQSDLKPTNKKYISGSSNDIQLSADRFHKSKRYSEEHSYSSLAHSSKFPEYVSFTSDDDNPRSNKCITNRSNENYDQPLTDDEKECFHLSHKKKLHRSKREKFKKEIERRSLHLCDKSVVKTSSSKHLYRSEDFRKHTSEYSNDKYLPLDKTIRRVDYTYRPISSRQTYLISHPERISRKSLDSHSHSFVRRHKRPYMADNKAFCRQSDYNSANETEWKSGFRSSLRHAASSSRFFSKKPYPHTAQTISIPSSSSSRFVMSGRDHLNEQYDKSPKKLYRKTLVHKHRRRTIYRGPPSPYAVACSYSNSLPHDSPFSPSETIREADTPDSISSVSNSCSHNYAKNKSHKDYRLKSSEFNSSISSSSSSTTVSPPMDHNLSMKARLCSVVSSIPVVPDVIQNVICNNNHNNNNYIDVYCSKASKTIASSNNIFHQASKESNLLVNEDNLTYQLPKITGHKKSSTVTSSCSSNVMNDLHTQQNIQESNGTIQPRRSGSKTNQSSIQANFTSRSISRGSSSTSSSRSSSSSSGSSSRSSGSSGSSSSTSGNSDYSSSSSSVSHSKTNVSTDPISNLSNYEASFSKDKEDHPNHNSQYQSQQQLFLNISDPSYFHTDESLVENQESNKYSMQTVSETLTNCNTSEYEILTNLSALNVPVSKVENFILPVSSDIQEKLSETNCKHGTENSSNDINLQINEKLKCNNQLQSSNNLNEEIHSKGEISKENPLDNDNYASLSDFENFSKEYKRHSDHLDNYKKKKSNRRKLDAYSSPSSPLVDEEQQTKKRKRLDKIKSVVVVHNDISKRTNVELNYKLSMRINKDYGNTEEEVVNAKNDAKTVLLETDDLVRKDSSYNENHNDDSDGHNGNKDEGIKRLENLMIEESVRQDDVEEEGEIVSDGTSEVEESGKKCRRRDSSEYTRLQGTGNSSSHVYSRKKYDSSSNRIWSDTDNDRITSPRHKSKILSHSGNLKSRMNLSTRHHCYDEDNRKKNIITTSYTNHLKYQSHNLKPSHFIHQNKIDHRVKFREYNPRSYYFNKYQTYPGRYFSSSLRKQIFFNKLYSEVSKPSGRINKLYKPHIVNSEIPVECIPSCKDFKMKKLRRLEKSSRSISLKYEKQSSSKSDHPMNSVSSTSTSKTTSLQSSHYHPSHKHYLKHSSHKYKYDHENRKTVDS